MVLALVATKHLKQSARIIPANAIVMLPLGLAMIGKSPSGVKESPGMF